MCGIAIATLHISASEFFDLSPIEFYYGMKAVGDRREEEYHVRYEVARYMAVNIINLTSQILKEPFRDHRDLTRFPWEKKDEPQSQEKVVEQAMIMARSIGTSTRVKEDMDGPPLNLAPKHKK